MLSEAERQKLRGEVRDAVAAGRGASLLEPVRRLMRYSPKPAAEAMFCASAVARLREAIASETPFRKIKTFIVRSVTLEPVLPLLQVEAALLGLLLDVEMGGYGSYVDDMMGQDSALARFAPDLTLVILDLEDIAGGLPALSSDGRSSGVEEEIEAAVERLNGMLRSLRAFSCSRIVLQGFVVPDSSSLGDVADGNLPHSLPHAVQRLNARLADLCRSVTDCIFFDVDQIASRFGRRRWSDRRMFLASRLPLSSEAFGAYGRALARSAAALFRAPRKLLCTDLDNTLWGGVLGEEGPQGIATGSVFPGNCYREYQRYLKQLASRGILLAAVSKNNEADVVEAFQVRSADLALTLDDFVAKKINWNDKTQSLREIASELSLGLDSFVFVDDNAVECEAIRQALPEVAVIGAPVDEPWRILDLLADEPLFDSANITEDDLNRTQEYRAQAQRAELESSSVSRDEFLGSLRIVCTFLPVEEAPLARAVQLLAKTNQFNLTTRRHSASEVERFASSGNCIAIAVRVRDRFGDAGVVGLGMAEINGAVCHVDSLLLSCRVIGRGIETALLAEIAERARRRGAHCLLGEYSPTRKNGLCSQFYKLHGFRAQTSDDDAQPNSVFYEFDLRETLESPAWLTLEGTERHEFATDSRIFA